LVYHEGDGSKTSGVIIGQTWQFGKATRPHFVYTYNRAPNCKFEQHDPTDIFYKNSY